MLYKHRFRDLPWALFLMVSQERQITDEDFKHALAALLHDVPTKMHDLEFLTFGL